MLCLPRPRRLRRQHLLRARVVVAWCVHDDGDGDDDDNDGNDDGAGLSCGGHALNPNNCTSTGNRCRYVKKPGQHCLLVGDARPQLNAYTNKVGGWGYEEASAYPFIELRFLNIDNIHKVRGALKKLSDTVMSGKTSVAELTNWFKTVEDTKWLFLVRTLLYGSIQCAYEMLKNRRSCLVHCSDGWDRTAQLSSLVQILLDPFARTIDGFCIVIQKDWLSFGHQFQKRVGHGHPEHDDTQRSPVFIQFLDATWQLLNQYVPVGALLFSITAALTLTLAWIPPSTIDLLLFSAANFLCIIHAVGTPRSSSSTPTYS